MGVLVPIAMFGFLPLALALFALMTPRRAVIATYLIAWLFLPVGGYHLAGLPEYSKVSAPALACLLGVALFHSGTLLRFKPGWLDLPMAALLASPVLTETVGGGQAGAYEGLATAFSLAMLFGVPWLMGRLFFTDLTSARELALGLVIGGLVYVPLCLIEARMSPQLNAWVYGFHQHAFNQTRRLGGWRPMVFMQHGLAVGMWMACTAVVAVWLWRAKVLPRWCGVSGGAWALLLLGTALLVRSSYAMILMALALGALWAAQKFGWRWALLGLVALGPTYMVGRGFKEVSLTPMVSLARDVFGENRARSLETRLENEQLIADKALTRPLFGWGGGGRYLVRDPRDPTRILSVPDQFWVITLGQGGLWRLAAMASVLLLPAAVFFRRCPPRDLLLPAIAPVATLAVVPVMFLLDCLMNAMMNPLFTLASASVAGVVLAASPRRAANTLPTGPVPSPA